MSDLALESVDPVERLVELCRLRGADRYVSGPSAKEYMRPEAFADRGIELVWFDYDGYPEYPQIHESFEHGVSVIDLILNTGPAASTYLKSGARDV